MSARTKSRKRALDLLYGADLKSLSIQEALEQEASRAEADRPRLGSWQYARQILEGIVEHLSQIDELIETHAQGWTIERMPIIDRAILRIGIWELRFNAEVPAAVAISEAVTAARTYSTEDSAGFVNGLLGRIAQLPESSPL
ncbi:MAG: transcription antitermination factor NusB [Cryobacterium sp.]|nr:transcription antitermination factor NusB [Cryobacterium sp.]MBX3115817.1 transcription antitermination factor NusB [Cryobacterium sp.]MCO5293922.1 transcription antitermination factor NusB [Homoserinimonas sp.]